MTHEERRARHGEWVALHNGGYTNEEIAQRYGVSRTRVWQVLSGKYNYARKPLRVTTERDAAWVFMYQSGKTLQEIGSQYGVTRERVRQRLAVNGVTGKDGGYRVSTARVRKTKAEARHTKAIRQYGMSLEERRAIPARIRVVFSTQKKSAASRGIQWDLTLREWLQIWNDSGKLDQRGRGRDRYCMSRKDDSGGYSIENVEIVTNQKNCGDHIRRLQAGVKRAKATIATGVYMLYPGALKPWCAKFGRKYLGHFATAQEAIAARQAYEKFLPPTQPRGFCRPGFHSERKAARMVSDDCRVNLSANSHTED